MHCNLWYVVFLGVQGPPDLLQQAGPIRLARCIHLEIKGMVD